MYILKNFMISDMIQILGFPELVFDADFNFEFFFILADKSSNLQNSDFQSKI